MPKYRVRVTQVRRVVRQADLLITAGSPEEAEGLAAEEDVNGWVSVDGTTEHQDEKCLYEEPE